MTIATIMQDHGMVFYQSPDGSIKQWWRPWLKARYHPDWIEVKGVKKLAPLNMGEV